ncbi:MFS transporter [Thermosporothrix hazakensis]|jgi:MFS family permease|uniref:MFS transporter n=2 Tax=Thermosporothrix TaxID=768650 RepID=A0A326TZ78_THEHA|nr:MFS transporter [Thermosporothrix hazakensis]PZW22590.1 MFS transporter [Thermosporothrix hazakensis]BBH90511.1 MFS transporter [Thermosporothrix sp. COM3]GCE48562.1 MFS transporter [Thermosporothrix hazakensis]
MSLSTKPGGSSASVRQVLRNPNFLKLWLAQLISLTILNATNYGVIVLVNDVTHSVFMAGLAIISFTLPALPFSAVAGVLVDRFDKRTVLWLSNLLRMVTVVVMFVSLLYDRTNVWPLFVLTYITSLIGQFFIPAEGSSIPLLVGERDIMPALSLFNISTTVSQALGFLVLGRFVVALFPPFTFHFGTVTLHTEPIDMLFLLVGALYVVCAILILLIPARAFTAKRQVQQKPKLQETHVYRSLLMNLWQDMLEGWRIVQADRLLFFAVVQLSVVGIIQLLIGELAGPFVREFLNRPPEDMSLILAPAGIGLVVASILMTPISEKIGKIRLTVIGFVALAVGFVLLPLIHWVALRIDHTQGASAPWVMIVTIVLVLLLGGALACVNIPTNTIMQERAPESGRARVLSLQFMLYNIGSIPVLLFAGAIAQFLGLNLLIGFFSACMLLFCWWASRFIPSRKQQPPHGQPQELPPMSASRR